ncbi:MAG TPA: hypothetical protein VLE94_09555 [Burkholderiaceae bacterium]|nr:hypothetical protein [Burkholderiaceae bacterium]
MHRLFGIALWLSSLVAVGCSSNTVLVSVPPRMPLQGYGTLGLVEFDSNAYPAINAQTTREFESHIHAAQPGTRIVELGGRDALLASVGGRQLDAPTLRRIGEKYGVDAIFVGALTYSEPKTDVKVTDLSRLEGGVRVEVRGDISGRLVETRSGASVWSSSAWARRALSKVNVSAEQGVSGGVRSGNPREEMVPTLVYHLTQDFRASTVRQPAP